MLSENIIDYYECMYCETKETVGLMWSFSDHWVRNTSNISIRCKINSNFIFCSSHDYPQRYCIICLSD